MANPRPKVQTKLPKITEWLLRNSTAEQLSYLNSIAGRDDFRILLKIVENLKHYNVYEVFSYQAKDDRDLAEYRAAMRGEVAAFDSLLYACQAAKIEIERRKREK